MSVIISSDQLLAKDQVTKWGYPFDFDRFEVYLLLKVGESVAWIWFEEFMDNYCVIHMCANPEYKGRWFNRSTYQSFYWAAKLCGKDRVYTLAKDGTSIVEYVKRLGWQRDELGWYLCLNR